MNLSEQTKNTVLEVLLQHISADNGQYMVDMGLAKFCQFLTRIIIIYWLVKSKFSLNSSIALGLLQALSSSQAIRILRPSF